MRGHTPVWRRTVWAVPKHPAPSSFTVSAPITLAGLSREGTGADGGWVEVENAEKGQSRRYAWVPRDSSIFAWRIPVD